MFGKFIHWFFRKPKLLFFIISESLIIFLSAVVGTFAWNHGSPIFNNFDWRHPCFINLWESIMNDIAQYMPAYAAVAFLWFILVIILFLRARAEDKEQNEKQNIGRINRAIREHLKKKRGD